jgi:hypothetical protein
MPLSDGGHDLRHGGGGTVDLRMHDLATTTPSDFATAADLSIATTDLAMPDLAMPDLTPPADLIVPADLACDGNACTALCVAQCFVQMKLGIGQCMNGVCNCVCV